MSFTGLTHFPLQQVSPPAQAGKQLGPPSTASIASSKAQAAKRNPDANKRGHTAPENRMRSSLAPQRRCWCARREKGRSSTHWCAVGFVLATLELRFDAE